MAAANQEQDAPNLHSAAARQHLDNLQSMLSLVFLSTGRFIKEHQSGGGTGRMKSTMQRNVPIATARFHDSLDQLENEVRVAQAVLKRDLGLLKQDRKRKLEAAAKQQEAEKARLAAESRNAGSGAKLESKGDKANPPAQPEGPLEKVPEQRNPSDETIKKDHVHVPPPIDTTTAPPDDRDPLFDGTPTTANPTENEFDFDAMFGDSMDTSTDNPQTDMMDTSNDLGFDFDQGPSLLRGLEDFANSADDKNNPTSNPTTTDIPMPDLPNNTNTNDNTNPPAKPHAPTSQPPTTNNPTKTENKPPPPPPPPPPPSANDTSTQDDPMSMMVTDNLEDLFNMDDYANNNPSDSAFDDAFFDFGT